MTDMIDNLDPENEIKNVDFGFDGAHLALCHKTQGFSANGKPDALLIKAEDAVVTDEAKELADLIKAGEAEVRIETDMVTFLRKWYGMWYDDAETLAMILGYNKEEVEEEAQEYRDYLAGKVEGITLLKSGVVPDTAKAFDVKALQDFIKANESLFKDSFSEGNSEMNKAKETSQSPSEKRKQKQGAIPMSEKDDVLTLEKAQSKLAEYEAKMVEIEKAAQAELEKATARIVELEKAEEARIMKAFEAKVETYSFVSEDERVELAKTLREVDSKQLIDILDKAQAAIQAALGEGTKGASVKEQESVDLNKSKKEGVAALLLKQFPQEV